MKKNKHILLSGPSGSGKTTVLNSLTNLRKFMLAKSYTTRPVRSEECHREYNFCSAEEFQVLQKTNFFCETEQVFGNYYGTPKSYINNDILVIFNLDVFGNMKMQKLLPHAITIGLYVDENTLMQRLQIRGEMELTKRLARVQKELRCLQHYDYLLENIDLDRTIEHLYHIIAFYEDNVILPETTQKYLSDSRNSLNKYCNKLENVL